MLNNLRFKFIDAYMRTNVTGIFPECLKTEWLSRSALEELQFRRLKDLLSHAGDSTPYFSKLYSDCGFDPRKISGFSDIRKIPIQTKQSIRANFDDLKSADFPKHAARITRTSGSTGEPFTIYHSGLAHTYLRALNFAAWNQAGYTLGDRYATFAGGSLMPDTIGFKQTVYAWLLNCRPLPSYHLSREHFVRYLNILQHEKVKYIYGYASALHDFSRTIEEQGLDFSFLRGVFTSSDMLYPPQRQSIERVLGVRIIDIYGNPESGLMSYECQEHDGFHQGMQNAFVEIADVDGNPVPDGTVGRVIVTSLNNRCFPIIRYDTGDEASISREECSCGRGLIKIKQLGGRSRDFIVLPDGRHIHGAFFNHLTSIYHAPWLDRYHIDQAAPDLLEFQCLVNHQPTPEELDAIASEIRTGTSGLLRVEVRVVDEIPMTRRGKYKLITRSFETEAE